MRYEYLGDKLDLVEEFISNELFDKQDLKNAISEFEDFKKMKPLDEVYIEIGDDGDYTFLTEEEYESTVSIKDDESFTLDVGEVNNNVLKDLFIEFLVSKTDESLDNLALFINEIDDNITVIPVKDKKPTIDVVEILEKVAPTSHHEQVTMTINFSANSFDGTTELSVILLNGTYTSLIGSAITTIDGLKVVVDSIINK